MNHFETICLADGTDVPKPASDALDEFETRWPGASWPLARPALAAEVKKALEKLGWEHLRHDEQTLYKVYAVLERNGYTPDQAATVVNDFQNAGILFRERS